MTDRARVNQMTQAAIVAQSESEQLFQESLLLASSSQYDRVLLDALSLHTEVKALLDHAFWLEKDLRI